MRKLSYLPYRRRKERQKKIIYSFLTCAFLAAAAFVLYIAFAQRGGAPKTTVLDLESAKSSASPSMEQKLPLSSFSQSVSSVLPSSTPAAASVLSEPKPVLTKEESYNYEAPIPESAPVENSYFDDAVFIGNSRLQGFILYAGLSKPRAYVDRGLAVDSALDKALFDEGGKKRTAIDALATNANFKKVYLMFGINELGWVHGDTFVQKYAEIVDRIREIQPEAEVYVHSVIPVSAKKSATDKIYNNEKIAEYNALLRAMAVEKQVFFVNVAEAVVDENGVLPEEASADGVHLKKPYCEKWLAYLKSHTYENWTPGEASSESAEDKTSELAEDATSEESDRSEELTSTSEKDGLLESASSEGNDASEVSRIKIPSV